MFKVHQPDKQALRSFLLAGGPGKRKWTKAEVDAKPASYWRARCRHLIPQPEELVAAAEAVMTKYATSICFVNQDPLITDEVRAAHKRQVQLMQQGALSGECDVASFATQLQELLKIYAFLFNRTCWNCLRTDSIGLAWVHFQKRVVLIPRCLPLRVVLPWDLFGLRVFGFEDRDFTTPS